MESIAMGEYGTMWRDINDNSGYMVSDKGFVIDKTAFEILQPIRDNCGCLIVRLRRANGKHITLPLDFLVKLHFG